MKKEISKYAEDLYWDFIQTYSYISVSRDVVQMFVDANGTTSDRERELDLLRDFVLSQDLADDVQE